MKQTITMAVPVTIDVPDAPTPVAMLREYVSASVRAYGPQPRDISTWTDDDRGHLYLCLTDAFTIVAGEGWWISPDGRNTLAGQAKAMRLIATHATGIADELDRRVAAAALIQQPAAAHEDDPTATGQQADVATAGTAARS